MKNTQRLGIMLTVILGLSLMLALVWTLQVLAAELRATQGTVEQFAQGTLYHTAVRSQEEDGEVRLMTIDIADEWETEINSTDLPGLMGHCAIDYGSLVFVVGGRQITSTAEADIYVTAIDFETGSLTDWSLETTVPITAYSGGVTMHGCAVVHDRLYVIGGLDGLAQPQDDVIFSRITTSGVERTHERSILADYLGEWQTAASLPEPRYGAEVVTLNDRIYVLGGAYPDTTQNQIWYAEVNEINGMLTWYTATATLPVMTVPYPGYLGHSAAASDDFIYVTGGTNRADGNGYFSPHIYYAAPAIGGDIGGFTQTIDMTRNLFGHTAVAVNGQLILLGGATDGITTPSDYVGAALLGQDGNIIAGWSETSTLVPARFWHATVVTIDSSIYVIGGSEGSFSPLQDDIIIRGSITGEGTHNYAKEGTFTSSIIEIEDLADRVLTALSWDATINNTTAMSLSMEYRHRPSLGDWSAWDGPYPSSATPGRITTTIPTLGLPESNQVQYRAIFQTTISDTPALHAVTAHFDVPISPVLYKSSVPPHGSVVGPGQLLAYTLVYSNPNSRPLAGLVITDYIPISTTLVPNSVYPPGFTIDPGGEFVRWDLGTVDALTTGEVGMTVRVRNDAPDGKLIVNGAQVDSLATLPEWSNFTHHTIDNVFYDLEVSKSNSLVGVFPGQIITYTIQYTNTNGFALTVSDLMLTETLSAYPHVSYVAGSGPWVEASPGVYTAEAGSLAPNTEGSVQFVAQVSPEIPLEIDLITNTVSIYGESSAGTDINSENQVAHDVDALLPLVHDLSVTKDDLTTAANPGDTLFYDITVLNQNTLGLPVAGVVLTETLDPASYMSYAGAGPWVAAGPGTYRYEVAEPLPAGTPLVIPFEVTVSLDLPVETLMGITNTVEVTTENFHGIDVDLNNNSFLDINIIAGPDLAVTKLELSPSSPAVGELLTIDVTIVNRGAEGTGTTSPHGEAFFLVEVYAKDADFNPAGSPDGPMDHEGGFCDPVPPEPPDTEWTCDWRYEYITWPDLEPQPVSGLEPEEEVVITFVITPTTSILSLYAQVDVTFDVPPDPGHPWGYPWGVHEEGNELNNIAEWAGIDAPIIYLPLILQRWP